MLYVVAFFLPWLGLFAAGKPGQAICNLIWWIIAFPLYLLFGIGGVIHLACLLHAFVVIGGANADRRNQQLIYAMRSSAPAYTPSYGQPTYQPIEERTNYASRLRARRGGFANFIWGTFFFLITVGTIYVGSAYLAGFAEAFKK